LTVPARLRSGWRFAIFSALFILFGGAAGALVTGLIADAAVDKVAGSRAALVVSSAISLVVALAVGWFCGKYLEKLPFRALGAWFTSGWLRTLLIGLIVGSHHRLIRSTIAPNIRAASPSNRTCPPRPARSLRPLQLHSQCFFIAAAFEEALFRGYILQTFARSGLAWFAIILTSVFFATVHLNNPNANLDLVASIPGSPEYGLALLI
jgi:uncharacterized protein